MFYFQYVLIYVQIFPINYLFKPIPNYFTNSHIHGIFEKDVINKPHFIEYWDEISSIIGNDVVIAHNAAFDLSVLRYILEFEQYDFPNLKYACTWRLSEYILDLDNYNNYLTLLKELSNEESSYNRFF